jgi:class 3 adenylate cyclase/predicted ATPase
LANPANAKFCQECGTSFGEAAEAKKPVGDGTTDIRISSQHPVGEIPEGERKTVTALFADIKGSTELMRDLDPEEARAIVDPVLQLMMAAVHRYGGYVAQSTGDGIFALFGAPIAHEDHPQRALHAALAMQEELHRYTDHLRNEGKIPVEARVGVNTGEVVVRSIQVGGHAEYTPVGHVTNLAARMQTLAPAGSIAASEATRRLCEGYFEFRALGPTAVKGLDAPVEVYEVVRAGPSRTHFQLSARRGLTKFVGREGELQQMKRVLELARSGHGQLIAVVAEAGTGKSRLFYEFKATLPAECKLLEAYSVSHGKASAWLPVLELLRGYFGLQDADDATTRREKVSAVLATLDPTLSDALPYLLGLLGIQEGPDPLAQMAPQVKRRRTFDAIKRIIVRESLNQPILVIFEDLHWIDGETQALLDLLADSIANSRVLLLVNYRPEYRHEWTNKSYYTQLRLDALGRESVGVMLSALLGDGIEVAPLKPLVIERTEGNPFFIEEMVQALFDEGALVRNGAVKVTRSLSQLRLPATVQGILAARIDRLAPEQKDLLQMLAVIGRESSLGLISQVASQTDTQLERMLAELQASEFIYEQPALADAEYVFKHALTQEVAYNSLLMERRKLLHERTGQALESMFRERLDDHLGELARHYGHCDNFSKAVDYLGRAGQQAMQRSAYSDAISGLTAAIDLLQKLPDSRDRIQRELLLQLPLGTAFSTVNGWGSREAERAYTRARQLCERLGDPPELFGALSGLCAVHQLRGQYRAAYKIGEQLLQRAQSAADPALLMHAHSALGCSLYFMGELHLAREHLETAISLYNPERDRPLGHADSGVNCRSWAAYTLWTLGYPDQALKRINEALALAQERSHPFSLAFAEMFAGFVHKYRREAGAARENAERVLGICVERGFPHFLGAATLMRGWAIAAQGRNEEGIAQIREGLAGVRASGIELGRPPYHTTLADACREADRLDDGLSAVTEALAVADEHEERAYEPEIHRVRGELLLRQDPPNAAEAQSCFQRAISVARNQNAKSWELRATMSLARLLAKQGHRDEARATLADIYNWFTEGFDTADLKDAKSLLDELGG